MPDLNSMTESIALPLWAVAAAAALLALLGVLAIMRIGDRQMLAGLAAVVVLVGIGWFVIERVDSQGKIEQRRALEARATALAAHALAPNSSLACLDAAGGTLVHEACEKALFASPEQIAAALNYVGARLELLREMAAFARRDEATYQALGAPIMRGLEADPFGFVAQILIARDGCSAKSCYAFDLLRRRDQLLTNMSERAYDTRVARFASSWDDKSGGSVAPTSLASQAPPQAPVNMNFPSAASIPPVSIMSNEPGRPGQNGIEASAKPELRPQPVPPVQAAQPPPPPQAPPPPRRPAQKAQPPRAAPQPAAPPPAADPFPQPVGAGQQTTGTQQPSSQ